MPEPPARGEPSNAELLERIEQMPGGKEKLEEARRLGQWGVRNPAGAGLRRERPERGPFPWKRTLKHEPPVHHRDADTERLRRLGQRRRQLTGLFGRNKVRR